MKDWPEIRKLEILLSEFCPISGDWDKLGIPNLVQTSLIKCCWFLQNARVTAFTVSELRENQQWGRGQDTPFQIRFNVPKALVCFSVSCIFNRFSLFFSCILNCSYLFFKSFSKRITNKLSLFYYSPLIRTNNIFSPTRHSFLSTLPDDNADIFANCLLISYFSVSSLILLSATFHQD